MNNLDITQWDGKGIPPVNAVCLVQLSSSEPLKARIDYVGVNLCVYTLFDVDDESKLHTRDCVADLGMLKFKPLPSHHDILMDDMMRIMAGRINYKRVAESLIEAGYRKITPADIELLDEAIHPASSKYTELTDLIERLK